VKKILIILLFFNYSSFAQKLYFTPSLGWGYGWGRNLEVISSVNNDNNIQFNTHSFTLQNPLLGLMIDYKPNENYTISLGRKLGKTELSSVNGGTIYTSAIFQKYGIDFSRKLFSINNQIQFSGLVGVYYIDNKKIDYNAGMLSIESYDDMGLLLNRISDTSLNIRNNGGMINFGLTIQLNSKNKMKEICSITVLYDQGLHDLVTLRNRWEYDYMSNYTYANSTSRGSLLSINVSKGFRIIKLGKPKE